MVERLSLIFIKFNNQMISSYVLNMGVADNNNNRKLSADFTNNSKLVATNLIFSFASVTRIL